MEMGQEYDGSQQTLLMMTVFLMCLVNEIAHRTGGRDLGQVLDQKVPGSILNLFTSVGKTLASDPAVSHVVSAGKCL